MSMIENNVPTKDVVGKILMKFFILYLPHTFKIINHDVGVEHWRAISYQDAPLQALYKIVCL
jgi:hypothetical protein